MRERSETSAGGVVYRRVRDAAGGAEIVEVVVAEQRDRITAALTTRLPKGKIDQGETLEQAALREVQEEVGLRARVVGSLGSVRYTYHEGGGRESVSKRVDYFLMECLAGNPLPLDGEMERVIWCSIDEGARRLTFETEKAVIERARAALATEVRG